MKVRKGFVTNSSSSSFICSICGEIESGMDLDLSEVEMYECENGHTFHQSCAESVGINFNLTTEEWKGLLIDKVKSQIEFWSKPQHSDCRKYLKEEKDLLEKINSGEMDEDEYQELLEEYEFRYSVPEHLCPICSMKAVDSDDLSEYMFKKHKKSKEEIVKEIKDTFSSYKNFKEYLKEGKNEN